MKKSSLLFVIICLFVISDLHSAQIDSTLYQNICFRSIGPASTSGRIADFAFNPKNKYEYYVGVASGNIWKTTNGGTTWQPVFENYGSYSIGCLAIDPENPHIVWAGTGENNSQRALGYGDGIYKTLDGGKTWKNMGLKSSRQIGKILIDPRNTHIVYAAAEGSVWGPGGERGLYKTTDGGESWEAILKISENTGIRDVVFDPGNPDVLYASSHQRRRRSFTKINGGPESAIYKSTNGGSSWRKLTNGLPKGDMGAIGLAVSPADPDFVYAIIEAKPDEIGFYRSVNRGESWEKMSDYNASSPQYYNEIFSDPLDKNKVYSMDTYSRVTTDGGKTFNKLATEHRHVDDHALWIDPDFTNHLIIGGDGGVYESFDAGNTWNFIANLPITQFYRVNVDDDLPFYNVYGGTQDNNTLTGPSKNISAKGITNDEWKVALGGDGFWIGLDPDDPTILYCEYQYGNAYRFNKKTGELFGIKPQEPKDEPTYKWNWDAPLIVSKHHSGRIFIAANKLFMSNDRGNSWQTISGDLTRQMDRNSFRVMGKFWSADAIAKDVSTSQWGTIVALAESPVKEGLLFVGTDDGLIQVTNDNGKTWKKTDNFPGVPEYTYVSDIVPSSFDASVVYATFNNHKSNDFKPYVLLSHDQGKTWKNISNNLPENGPVNTLVQDYEKPGMLFVGTEFGVFMTLDQGENWVQLKSGIPTICVKDLVIQKRECDLVVATFGRGFYILEDYSILRHAEDVAADNKARIFPVKNAYQYLPTNLRSKRGDAAYYAKNPDIGTVISYYVDKTIKSGKEIREKKEKELFKNGEKIPVLSWHELRKEGLEEKPYLLFIIRDGEGNIIRKLGAKPEQGIHRITWDLKYPDLSIPGNDFEKFDPMAETEGDIHVMPGDYNVSMALVQHGKVSLLQENIPFTVKLLHDGEETSAAGRAYRSTIHQTTLSVRSFKADLKETQSDLQRIKQRHFNSRTFQQDVLADLVRIENQLDDIDLLLNGFKLKASPEEVPPHKKSVSDRLSFLISSVLRNTSDPSENQLSSLKILSDECQVLKTDFEKLKEELKLIEDDLGL